jgi:PII-like signaling protein
MYSEDLAVMVEIVDSEERIMKFVALLAGFSEIGLVTYDEVRVLLHPPAVTSST